MTDVDNTVAVVGLALRVPGAADPETFWSGLADGRVSLPAARSAGETGGPLQAGQIDRFAEFDAELFGMSRAQAAVTDPQHRVLTELVWQALEDAGIDPGAGTDRVGVFAGCGPDAYLHANVLGDEQLVRVQGQEQIQLGNSRDFLATAVSYRLGLTGPSMTVQTACSTSLVAVHQAVRSLLTYECDIAVAGGVTIHPVEQPTYEFTEGGIVSPDGRCRAFTEGSLGTVPASGAGVVVLRRAADLDEHGASGVRAHIVGSAVNNDGADRMSLVSPSPRGQADVIREALESAGLSAADVGYIETHGTGTVLGDQIELAALAEVYGTEYGQAPCALGAVKPNIGHCDTAAGVVGLIKTVLAVRERTVPPTPAQPGDGPDVALGSPRFFIPRKAEPWGDELPQYAAVSSFGLGGTNAHVIVAPARTPQPEEPSVVRNPGTAVLSAATDNALRDKARSLAHWLQGPGTDTPLADILGTLKHNRRPLDRRWAAALPADETAARERLRDELTTLAEGGGRTQGAVAQPTVAALLPGQGVSLAGVGTSYAAVDDAFRADVGTLTAEVAAAGGPDLSTFGEWAADDPRLTDTAVVQPALFVLGTAALRLLERRGIRPGLLLGHSVGELTAAAHAGVLTAGEAAAAVVERGRLMAGAPQGAMTAVRADESTALGLADGLPVDVCGLNAPDNTVLGGAPDAVSELEHRCRDRGIAVTRLATSRAFHSRTMTEAADEFARFLGQFTLRTPSQDLTILSNLTGAPLTAEQATDPGYWARQLRSTVRLDDALRSLLNARPDVVLGLHRGKTMTNLARQEARRQGNSPLITDLFGVKEAEEGAEPLAVQDALAQLWTAGCPLDLGIPHPGRTVRLPPYPFADTRHWVDAVRTPERRTSAGNVQTAGNVQEGVIEPQPQAEGEPEAATEDGTVAVIASLWQSAFGGDPLRPEDNFFSLGGTSLQAAQLITVVNNELLLNMRLQDLYENSSLGDFAARADALVAERDDDELLRLLDEIENGGGLEGES
ncbi:acyltransferase domain-containing protein (plasmid) [Streptomyces sp. BHT-5-2]|uniref:type I polyketide synthase n=1 Tax=Streptomyces sp. BHT-5-2 TaxID=2866715 RepID=UPI001C8DA6A1|nr:type I polyketide synthase [Streptomyces sp. BHT-5-2]QZL08997.1 acyltransferase domain-containing protein [Streptomyces sp. BHT-5-2]